MNGAYSKIRDKIENGDYENRTKWSPENRAAHRKESYELEGAFRKDLAEAFGLTGHAKEEKVFRMAWDRGHSSGWTEVLSEYADLAELVTGANL